MGSDSSLVPFAAGARWDSGTLYMSVQGELDVASREEFNRCFSQALEHRFDRLVLDLSRLTFIDSVGLKSVLDVWNRSRSDRFPMTVVPGQRQVQRAFALSGLDALMAIEEGALKRGREPALTYMHCPHCRAVIEDHDGLLAGVERCPECRTALELSPPSMFRGSVRHPALEGGASA
jgi:anti-sigma B factor antagonist